MTRDDSLTILDRDQQAGRTEVYLEDQWQLLPRLSLTLGARGSHYDQTGRNYFEPRAAASWRISDRFTLRGAYGQYHQFVNQVVRENVTEGSRDFWLLADTTLVPVQGATHYIAGVTYETPDFLFAVEAYRKDLNGLAEFSLRFDPGGANIDKLFYSGTGVARGVEFLAQKKFGRYTGWVSYTLGRAENTFPGLNNGAPFPALQDQTHELKAVGSASLGRWTLSSTWTFGSGKPYTAPESEYVLTLLDGTDFSYIHVGEKNGLRLPAYHRLDVAAQYRFQLGPWQGELGLSVFNLYNRANVWYRQFDLSTTPLLVTDVRYLGLTPNLFVQLHY
jgi:outer membrane receptor protein involved in Fe transport